MQWKIFRIALENFTPQQYFVSWSWIRIGVGWSWCWWAIVHFCFTFQSCKFLFSNKSLWCTCGSGCPIVQWVSQAQVVDDIVSGAPKSLPGCELGGRCVYSDHYLHSLLPGCPCPTIQDQFPFRGPGVERTIALSRTQQPAVIELSISLQALYTRNV